MSNLSLNIILCDLITILKATTNSLPQILKIKLKQRYPLKLWTHCEPTSVFHDEDVITQYVHLMMLKWLIFMNQIINISISLRVQCASREAPPTHTSDWLWYLIDSVTCGHPNCLSLELGMGDTSYFIFDTIPIFLSPVLSIPIPLNITDLWNYWNIIRNYTHLISDFKAMFF